MSLPFEVKEIESKSILTPSKLPDADYVVNPYTGCRFGCTYCYASFMGRYVGKEISDWGNYVFVKTNAVELLKNDIQRLKNRGKDKSIFFSSVTDPYQGLEAKYELTRKCLQVLADHEFEGLVSILTKSDLVLRDIDVLKKLNNVEIGFTVTSTDDSISRYFEKFAPNVSQRLSAMKKLNELGFKTYAFVGPLLPHFVAEENKLDELFKAISNTGNNDLYVEHINLSKYILERLMNEMKDTDLSIINEFYGSKKKEYREKLDKLVQSLIQKYNLHLRTGETIYHEEMMKKN